LKLFKTILIAHAVYILLTAVWPIVDIESFMKVTGPKTDVWLVKTVGALLIPVGLCLLSCISIAAKRPAIVLGTLTCISFITIDFYYAVTDVISDVYLIDAFVQGVFLLGWMFVLMSNVIKPAKV
jgi:hypothetical protein